MRRGSPLCKNLKQKQFKNVSQFLSVLSVCSCLAVTELPLTLESVFACETMGATKSIFTDPLKKQAAGLCSDCAWSSKCHVVLILSFQLICPAPALLIPLAIASRLLSLVFLWQFPLCSTCFYGAKWDTQVRAI